MRAILLATTAGAAQSMAVTTKSKKPAVQALLESATTMLKNGATPEVVTFAQYTLQEVTETVMPAIISESQNDQSFINDLHQRFTDISTALDNGNAEIAALNQQENGQAADHRNCREQEYADCYGECAVEGCDDDFTPAALTECKTVTTADYGEGKRKCEQALHDLWADWVTAEGDLKEYHDLIHGHFCPNNNGTTKVFRDSASGWMQHYMNKKVLVDEALEDYDMKTKCCEVSHSKLDAQSASCNQKQTLLENTACQHANKIVSVLTTYYRDYGQAKSSYSCAVEEVMQLETDRRKEWVTLEVVRCLLDKIEQQNGKPCEEASGGVAEVVANCEEKHSIDVCAVKEEEITEEGMDEVDWNKDDVRALCINYPTLPPHPPTCEGREAVGKTRCLPVPIPTCTDRSTWHHFAGLPGFPQPHFSKGNPGCNEYPECSTCEVPPTPQPVELNSCPGYTVSGCPGGEDDSANPVTFIRSVDGRADVRCCSDAAAGEATCQSQDFLPVGDHSPVDFATPSGGTHTKCYFGVTYQTALEVCHAVDMHICTVDQIAARDCCGTGCWHNDHAIWVVRAGSAVAASADAANVMGGAYDTWAAATQGDEITYHTQAQNQELRDSQDGSLRGEHYSEEDNFQAHRCAEGMPGWPGCRAFLEVADGNCQSKGDEWEPITTAEMCKEAATALGFDNTEPEPGDQTPRPEGCAIGSNGNLVLYTNTANAGNGASDIGGGVVVHQVCHSTQITTTTTSTTPDWRDPANHDPDTLREYSAPPGSEEELD